jgi:citrate synthase
MAESVNVGLEGVLVAESAISNVEGDIGRLSYRGIDINKLVNEPFLKVVFLLILGRNPEPKELADLENFLIAEGRLSDSERKLLACQPKDLHPMLMLQSMVPALSLTAKTERDFTQAFPQLQAGLIIAAKIPTLIANWFHLQGDGDLVDYPALDNFHANFLRQFNQQPPTELQVRTLDLVQMLQLEHSMNAGTFAGRVVASTQAPIQSVIAASIGALFGKLHGGADQAAVEMAVEIGSPAKVADYVEQQFANKRKIMGMGHREYKVVDPRAVILKPMARELCQDQNDKNLLATLETVEHCSRQHFAANGKDIWANVEFYKGVVFQALGIPPQFFTAMFAMARVNGYIAHFLEFNQNPRLIRPQAIYTAV